MVGLLALIPSITGTTGTPVLLRLAFSPDFQTEGLSPPKVQLPDGKIVQPDQIFALQPSPAAQVVTVGVDKGLNEVRNLRQASAKLAQTVQSVAEQRDALATQAASATGAPAAKENLQAQSQQSAQLQNQVVRSIQVGDFANANALSARLHTSVIAARPAVEAISRSRPE